MTITASLRSGDERSNPKTTGHYGDWEIY